MEATMVCFALLTFCFLAASMAVELVVSTSCSRLVQVSSFVVETIKVMMGEGSQGNGGLALYGLAGAPPFDVPAAWSEARRVVVPADSHREWVYFLNRGSQIEVPYSVKPETELAHPLCVVIAQDKEGPRHTVLHCIRKESFTQWIGRPHYHGIWCVVSSTVSMVKNLLQYPVTFQILMLSDLITGNGTIKQNIDFSCEYYIAVGNSNDQNTDVLLEFRIRTLFYNTTGADYVWAPGHALCAYRLPLLGQNVAILSYGLEEVTANINL